MPEVRVKRNAAVEHDAGPDVEDQSALADAAVVPAEPSNASANEPSTGNDAGTELATDPCKTDNGGCGDPDYIRCRSEPGQGRICMDIDECKQNNGGCGEVEHMRCINRRGEIPDCRDIDECELNNGYCGDPKFWRCINQHNAAPSCMDIDECETDNGNCGEPERWQCTNHRDASATCSDLDECLTDNGGCSTFPKAICTNQAGAPPACACPYGGPGDGWTCTRFTHDDTTVIDYSTGLMWQRNVDSRTFTQSQAVQYCAQISGSGWRLPSSDELISLQDQQFQPTIDPSAFPNTPAGSYWSSSTTAAGPTWFIHVNFTNGGWGSGKDNADMMLYVRCVRTLSCNAGTCL